MYATHSIIYYQLTVQLMLSSITIVYQDSALEYLNLIN